MCASSYYYKTVPQAFGLDVGETAMPFNTYRVLTGFQAPVLLGGCPFTGEETESQKQ